MNKPSGSGDGGGGGGGDLRRPPVIRSLMGPSNQTEENKKILKEIEEQKRQLKLQHHQHTGPSSPALPGQSSLASPSSLLPTSSLGATAGSGSFFPPSMSGGGGGGSGGGSSKSSQELKMAAMQALQHAKTNSLGYYVTQDSSFGNLIIPALPTPVETPPRGPSST